MEWNIATLEELEDKIWRCTACGNCKAAYNYGPPPEFGEICPAGAEFGSNLLALVSSDTRKVINV